MRNHTTWTAILAAALLVTLNALALPKLLNEASAMPEGEVVLQVAGNVEARLPLPEIPKGFSGYELKFSRALSDRERQTLDEAGTVEYWQEGRYGHFSHSMPRITYSAAAAARYLEATGERPDFTGTIRSEADAGNDHITRETCEIGIDLGAITVFLPETTELTEAQATSLRWELANAPGWSLGIGLYGTGLDDLYDRMYADFRTWLGHRKLGAYTMSRGMCPDERARYEQLVSRYQYEGLRAQTPLLTARPGDDAMWYDESIRQLHLR